MSLKSKDESKLPLTARYEDPEVRGSLGGVRRFALAHRVPLQRAKRELEGSLAYTLHKPRRKRFPTAPVVVYGIDEQWAADLVEVQKLARYNKGMRYLLTVIDVFSKYAWVRPLPNKTGKEVQKGFASIFKEGRKPASIQTDDGKEFYNAVVSEFFKRNNVHRFSTLGDTKANVAERFNRTLKERLYRFFLRQTTHWIVNTRCQL